MRVRIEIDAGEREAVFVREPRIVTYSDRPEAVLVDELVGAYMEAPEWLERGKPSPTPAAGEDQSWWRPTSTTYRRTPSWSPARTPAGG